MKSYDDPTIKRLIRKFLETQEFVDYIKAIFAEEINKMIAAENSEGTEEKKKEEDPVQIEIPLEVTKKIVVEDKKKTRQQKVFKPPTTLKDRLKSN